MAVKVQLSFIGVLMMLFSCSSGSSRVNKDDNNRISRPDTTFVTTKIMNSKLSLSIPSNWVKDDKGRVVVFKQKCDSSKFCPNFVVSVIPSNAVESKQGLSFPDLFLQKMESSYESFRVINISNKKINGINASVIDYILYNKLHLGGTTVMYEAKDEIIQISFMAINEPEGEYVKYRNLYNKIINSVYVQ